MVPTLPAETPDRVEATDARDLPRHAALLRELEEKARICCKLQDLTENPPQRQPEPLENLGSSSTWTLADDARLLSCLDQISRHIEARTIKVSHSIMRLHERVGKASSSVQSAQSTIRRLSEKRSLHLNLTEGTDADKTIDTEAPVANQTEEWGKLEREAVSDGMKALDVFYDPAHKLTGNALRTSESDENLHYDGEEVSSDQKQSLEDPTVRRDHSVRSINAQEEDSFWCYDASPNDIYNQRPLPFIIGSREFYESNYVGLGVEFDGDDDDDDDDDCDAHRDHNKETEPLKSHDAIVSGPDE